jgi:putative Mn2+ efflux pump MntP
LLATALGTNIDAMAVGVPLAFLDVNILVISLAIGVANVRHVDRRHAGRRLIGMRFGRWAEIVGGVALCRFGLSILVDHLTS